jgi:hypothetical protein
MLTSKSLYACSSQTCYNNFANWKCHPILSISENIMHCVVTVWNGGYWRLSFNRGNFFWFTHTWSWDHNNPSHKHNTLKFRICTGLSYFPDDKTSYCDAFLVCIQQNEWSSTLRRTSKCWTIVMHLTSIYQITNHGIVPWTYDDHPYENCVSTIVKKTVPWKLSLLFKKFDCTV